MTEGMNDSSKLAVFNTVQTEWGAEVINFGDHWREVGIDDRDLIRCCLKINRGYDGRVSTLNVKTMDRKSDDLSKLGNPFFSIDFTFCDNMEDFKTREFFIDELGVFPVIEPLHLINSFHYMIYPELDPVLGFEEKKERQKSIINMGFRAFEKSRLGFGVWLGLHEEKKSKQIDLIDDKHIELIESTLIEGMEKIKKVNSFITNTRHSGVAKGLICKKELNALEGSMEIIRSRDAWYSNKSVDEVVEEVYDCLFRGGDNSIFLRMKNGDPFYMEVVQKFYNKIFQLADLFRENFFSDSYWNNLLAAKAQLSNNDLNRMSSLFVKGYAVFLDKKLRGIIGLDVSFNDEKDLQVFFVALEDFYIYHSEAESILYSNGTDARLCEHTLKRTLFAQYILDCIVCYLRPSDGLLYCNQVPTNILRLLASFIEGEFECHQRVYQGKKFTVNQYPKLLTMLEDKESYFNFPEGWKEETFTYVETARYEPVDSRCFQEVSEGDCGSESNSGVRSLIEELSDSGLSSERLDQPVGVAHRQKCLSESSNVDSGVGSCSYAEMVRRAPKQHESPLSKKIRRERQPSGEEKAEAWLESLHNGNRKKLVKDKTNSSPIEISPQYVQTAGKKIKEKAKLDSQLYASNQGKSTQVRTCLTKRGGNLRQVFDTSRITKASKAYFLVDEESSISSSDCDRGQNVRNQKSNESSKNENGIVIQPTPKKIKANNSPQQNNTTIQRKRKNQHDRPKKSEPEDPLNLEHKKIVAIKPYFDRVAAEMRNLPSGVVAFSYEKGRYIVLNGSKATRHTVQQLSDFIKYLLRYPDELSTAFALAFGYYAKDVASNAWLHHPWPKTAECVVFGGAAYSGLECGRLLGQSTLSQSNRAYWLCAAVVMGFYIYAFCDDPDTKDEVLRMFSEISSSFFSAKTAKLALFSIVVPWATGSIYNSIKAFRAEIEEEKRQKLCGKKVMPAKKNSSVTPNRESALFTVWLFKLCLAVVLLCAFWFDIA